MNVEPKVGVPPSSMENIDKGDPKEKDAFSRADGVSFPQRLSQNRSYRPGNVLVSKRIVLPVRQMKSTPQKLCYELALKLQCLMSIELASGSAELDGLAAFEQCRHDFHAEARTGEFGGILLGQQRCDVLCAHRGAARSPDPNIVGITVQTKRVDEEVAFTREPAYRH